MLPNTTSDDAANAANIVDQSYEADWSFNGAAVSTGPDDNFFRVIVDVQPYRLSRLVQRRHSQLCLAISLADTGIPPPPIRIPGFEFAPFFVGGAYSFSFDFFLSNIDKLN